LLTGELHIFLRSGSNYTSTKLPEALAQALAPVLFLPNTVQYITGQSLERKKNNQKYFVQKFFFLFPCDGLLTIWIESKAGAALRCDYGIEKNYASPVPAL
jgi:hypothetical protein